jgi:hypothetical protein
MCTLVISEVACGRTSTVLAGTTVPVASSVMGTSRLAAGTVVTLTGGAEAAAAAAAAAADAAAAAAAEAAAAGEAAADAAVDAAAPLVGLAPLASDLPPQPAASTASRQSAPSAGPAVGSAGDRTGGKVRFGMRRA